MRICSEHWARIRELVDSYGLAHLVANDGYEAIARMKKEIEGGADASTFDPLMVANNLILQNAMSAAGLEIMQANEDGSERCPVCFVRDSCTCGAPDCRERYERWPENAVRDAAAIAKELGLVAEA